MPRRLLLGLLAPLALVLPGCGSSSSSTDGADPATAVPASAFAYATVQIHPQGDVKAGVEAAARKILAGRQLGPELDKLLERSSHKVDYEHDVKPWLGQRAAVFASSLGGTASSYAVLVETKDAGQARASIAKSDAGEGRTSRSYRGESYTVGTAGKADGVVGGYAVMGSEAGVKAVIDTLHGGSKLSDSSAFEDATNKVRTDQLALFYLDTPKLLDALSQSSPETAIVLGQLRSFPGLQNAKPVAADLTADGDGIRFETPGSGTSSAAEDAVAALPADSWLAFAAPNAGDGIRAQFKALAHQQGGATIAQLDQLLEQQSGIDLQKDVLSWIGGVRAFFGGTTPLGLEGALVIDSKDPAASARFIAKIAPLVRRSAKVPFRRVPGGFELQVNRSLSPVSFVARGKEVFVAYGRGTIERALHPAARLGSTDTYRLAERALGGGRPSFLVSVPAIVQLVQNLGQGGSPGFAKSLPYLRAFGAIAAGRKRSGGQTLHVLAVGLK